jgi:hypothetical protein
LFFITVYGIFFNYEQVLLRFNLSNKMTKTVGGLSFRGLALAIHWQNQGLK